MLSEHFIAAISTPSKTPDTSVAKDAGIFFFQSQPLAGQKAVFKKSAAPPNCVAVSQSHIFASQLEKAVVHVYNREKGNQEAIVPFQERVTALALVAGDEVLVLGTESGRVLLWEICTGRLVSAATSHLQQVNAIAVDPTSNFLLTGSADSNISVWSLPGLLSFSADNDSKSPIHTLSTHRGAITAIVCGHSRSSANIAISTSQDKSAIVWDFQKGSLLRTYLLGDVPLALTLDPADRAFYTAYEDGSVQIVDFYDDAQKSTATNTLHDSQSSSTSVVEPSKNSRWHATSQNLGKTHSVSLSWDSTSLISGHESGKVARWDIAKGIWQSTIATLPGPVTNLQFLPPTGFLNEVEPKLKITNITKPRHDNTRHIDNGSIPGNYTFTAQITNSDKNSKLDAESDFSRAFASTVLPDDILADSLTELYAWSATSKGAPSSDSVQDDGFVSFANDASADGQNGQADSDQVRNLQSQLESLQKVQKATFKQLAKLRQERDWWIEKEKKREQQRASKLEQKLPSGHRPTTRAVTSKAGDNMEVDHDGNDAQEDLESSESDAVDEEDLIEYMSTDEEEQLRQKAAKKGKQKAKR